MNRRRLVLSPLWFLVALVTLIVGGTSSAHATPGLETRVRAIDHVEQTIVGPAADVSPGSVGCLRPSDAAIVVGACVATEAANVGPRVGPGASLDNLTTSEVTRIQNAADKVNQPISVVGSRASGTAGPYSDWDYVVPGANSKTIGKIKNSLPEGPRGIGDPRNIDIFRGTVNEDLPFITFTPGAR